MQLPHIHRIEADAVRATLDPALRAQADAKIRAACARFLREVTDTPPPLQHAVPVLALARAIAALVLVFGDPALVEIVAEEARRALHDSNLTVPDLFPGATP